MKYLLIMGHDDNFGPTAELTSKIIKWNKDMKERKKLIYSNPLQPWQSARTIKTVNGKKKITEGTFVTSNIKVAAYALIDAVSIDEALQIASEHPMSNVAVVEVRPVWENI